MSAISPWVLPLALLGIGVGALVLGSVVITAATTDYENRLAHGCAGATSCAPLGPLGEQTYYRVGVAVEVVGVGLMVVAAALAASRAARTRRAL